MLKGKIAAAAGTVLGGLTMAATVLAGPADPNAALNTVQQQSGLGSASAVEVVGNVINVFLGLLGVIALIFIVWSGFNWMMSKGDATKIKEAQGMMKAAVVGLIVVLASYSIASFVINNLVTATSTTGA